MNNKFSQIKIEWIEITRGEFTFGLSVKQAEDLLRQLPARYQPFEEKNILRETPERAIKLDTFYISRFPITWKQFMLFAESEHIYSYKNIFTGETQRKVLDNRRRLSVTAGNHPAIVGWQVAQSFCCWIGARLPTSPEWEKAARGTDDRLYPWGNKWDTSRGNFNLDRERWPEKTSPVDAYPSGQSPYGVMDMMGNTYEYTWSIWVGNEELLVGRSCSCDFSHTKSLDWIRNRLTKLSFHPINGGMPMTGFRPVLDKWQKKHWPGFRIK